MNILKRKFYSSDTINVARGLLGKMLVRDIDGQKLSGVICETEAYLGDLDSASHAYRGKTARNSVMFGPPGMSYIYFIYGKHFMLNVVTGGENIPHAVLIRGILPVNGIEQMQINRGATNAKLTDGPGKLCNAMRIDKSLNDIDLTIGKSLWVEEYLNISQKNILSGPRIGIEYALQKDKDAHRRFWIRLDNYLLSK